MWIILFAICFILGLKFFVTWIVVRNDEQLAKQERSQQKKDQKFK